MKVPRKYFYEEFEFSKEKDLLGEGAFGKVYKARSRSLDLNVALKIYKHVSSAEVLRENLGKIIRLNHPNLIRYFNYFHILPETGAPEEHVLVTEYANGGDLRAWFKENKNNDFMIKDVLRQFFDALIALEEKKMIHRDIKPQNVLLEKNRMGYATVKLADFGLTREVPGSLFKKSEKDKLKLEGTPQYLAPELLDRSYAAKDRIFKDQPAIRTNVDLWSVGVLLFKLFTGKYPVGGDDFPDGTTSILRVMGKIMRDPVPRSSINRIREPYRSIISKCLVKNAAKRVQSAKELIILLDGKKINEKGTGIQLGKVKHNKK